MGGGFGALPYRGVPIPQAVKKSLYVNKAVFLTLFSYKGSF